MRKVYITGMGAIAAIGNDIEQIASALRAGHTGIDNIRFIDTTFTGTIPACEVKHTDIELAQRAGVGTDQGYTRLSLLALIAASEAIRNVCVADVSDTRTGLISATTCGGMREFEQYFYDLQDLSKTGPFAIFADTLDSANHTEKVARILGITEFMSTISTACSSSANAIILGAQLIKHGMLDRVVCGGADAFCKFTLNGFNSLMILDREHCRPFDKTRAGLNLGEGAAYIVLESETLAKGKSNILAELTGYSNTNDAFHQTASSPDGGGAKLAMEQAIQMAGISPSDISYINAHGTGTENNDLTEGFAIQGLFGDKVPPFSSTKPYTGHTLAASGSIEAVFSLLAIQRGMIYPNLNFKEQIEELEVSPVTSLLENVQVDHVLSNSFGFGGSNTSLLFSKVKQA
jgi:3-oxoacyl-[acyl-carrier-protein] synthase-1